MTLTLTSMPNTLQIHLYATLKTSLLPQSMSSPFLFLLSNSSQPDLLSIFQLILTLFHIDPSVF
jgi:hypothetical protein